MSPLSGGGLCRRSLTCKMYNMKYYVAIASVLLVAALAVPPQGVAARDRVIADSAALEETNSRLSSSTLKNDLPSQPPIAAPSSLPSSSGVYEVPSINGRYSIQSGGELCCRISGQDFLEAMAQSSIVPLAGRLLRRAILGFEVSLDTASPRMSSKWVSAFRFNRIDTVLSVDQGAGDPVGLLLDLGLPGLAVSDSRFRPPPDTPG